jgi:AcrR family transcriptional regulator
MNRICFNEKPENSKPDGLGCRGVRRSFINPVLRAGRWGSYDLLVKRLSKAERRGQILEAAIRAFGAKGYHGTQVSDIIAEAGVARGTFYLYFESKREIFEAIVSDIITKVHQVIHPINKEDLTKVPGEILGNIERSTTLLLNNPVFIKIFFSDAVGLDGEFDGRLRHFYREILQSIQGGLTNGQRMGIIREGDTEVLALCLMGSLKEILYQYFLGTHRPPLNKIVQEVYRIVLHATVKPEWVEQLLSKSLSS